MGLIYLYTGNGGGKTTNALGLALRAVGHKQKAIIIQFMKGRETGEVKISGRLKPYYEIYQFGRKEFVNLKNPSNADKKLAERGLKFAEEALKRRPFLLVLDEINLACAIGLINTKEVISLLKKVPRKTTVVLTGRYAPKELEKASDFVNEIIDRKHPKKIIAKKGIQY